MRWYTTNREAEEMSQSQKHTKWRKWFAWYPVILTKDRNGEYRSTKQHTWVWLEHIERKYEYYGSGFYGHQFRSLQFRRGKIQK